MIFSSFVNSIVLATIHSEEGIASNKCSDMPLVSRLFGTYYGWALRDAVASIGSYDEIYRRNFADADEGDRGRNNLNQGGPQIHSFSGLHL